MQPNGKVRLARGETGLERMRFSWPTLRFPDPAVEAAFRADYYRNNLWNIRFTFLAGAVAWVIWGVVLYPHILAVGDKRLDLIMRYGVFIPMLLVAFGLSFTRRFERIWEWAGTGAAVASIVIWVYYIAQVLVLPPEYGYVGLILITAFTYTVLRLRFILVMLITVVGIAAYLPYALTAVHFVPVTKALAALVLFTFGTLGGVAAYRQERFARLLFLRERQLHGERERSDTLLKNILPQAIVDRLRSRRDGKRVAEALDDVTVLFADAVGFTEQAAKTSPEEIVAALDELFRRFDGLADRYGLEKIKTVGDAYMAVAGAPVPVADHAARAAEMALDIVDEAYRVHWPSGERIVMRIGVACGPVVAGVIGDRKFAYDLWGDTVNLASRLESQGSPGRIMVSEAVAERLAGRYRVSDPEVVDLRGRGPTTVRFLLGRLTDRDSRQLARSTGSAGDGH